jgi:hypothetical protein
MAYCGVEELKEYLGVTGTADDAMLLTLLAAAQHTIDSYCARTFEATADTVRTFDSQRDVDGYTLTVDSDLCAITSIVNGDGTTISNSHYVTEPRNETPYYAIRLKTSAGKVWTSTVSGDSENAITITGKWAYSTSAPSDIAHVCKRLAAYIYRQKDNAGDLDRAVIAGNSTILPAQIPSDIRLMLTPYKRLSR